MSGMEVRFNHVLSLGTLCKTAWHIRASQLSRYVGPFDWIFSTPDVVRHCVEDRFADFMNRDLLVAHESRLVWTNSLFEKRYGLSPLFNHHDVFEPASYERFQRSTQRFMDVIEGDQSKLLIAMANIEIDPSAFESLMAKMGGSNRLILIHIRPFDPALTVGHFELIGSHASIDRYEVFPVSAYPTGLGFEAETDNEMIKSLLARYDFDLLTPAREEAKHAEAFSIA